jgi:hypothetical protein
MDTTNIFLDPVDPDIARQDSVDFMLAKANNRIQISDNRVITVQATEYNGD